MTLRPLSRLRLARSEADLNRALEALQDATHMDALRDHIRVIRAAQDRLLTGAVDGGKEGDPDWSDLTQPTHWLAEVLGIQQDILTAHAHILAAVPRDRAVWFGLGALVGALLAVLILR